MSMHVSVDHQGAAHVFPSARVVVLFTSLCVMLLPSRTAAAQPVVTPALVPSTIQVAQSLEPILAELLRKSATFRRQWDQILAAAHVRVTVVTIAPPSGLTITPRARTTMVHFAYGLLKARVEIPAAADHAELLAHEFEHVIEQIEGLDLAELNRAGDARVVRMDDGMYETNRAKAAGRAAAAEVYGTTDPFVRMAVGAVSRMLRAISARATTAATGPPPFLVRR